jgi:hypothetical protein
LFFTNGREVLEELRKIVPTLQIVEQVLDRYTRAGKNRRSADYLRIARYQTG